MKPLQLCEQHLKLVLCWTHCDNKTYHSQWNCQVVRFHLKQTCQMQSMQKYENTETINVKSNTVATGSACTIGADPLWHGQCVHISTHWTEHYNNVTLHVSMWQCDMLSTCTLPLITTMWHYILQCDMLNTCTLVLIATMWHYTLQCDTLSACPHEHPLNSE